MSRPVRDLFNMFSIGADVDLENHCHEQTTDSAISLSEPPVSYVV